MKNISFDQLPEAVNQLNQKLENIESLLLKQQSSTPVGNHEKILNVKQVAEMLGLTVPTIYSKVNKGELPYMKLSKKLYFSTLEIMEYLKRGTQNSILNTEDASQFLTKK